MKKLILASATVLFIGLTAFAQNITYNKQWYKNENTALIVLTRK
jgi:hypothetical protein